MKLSNDVAVFFDLDGTLIDSTPAILKSFHHTFDTLGGSADDESIKALIGHPLEYMYAKLGVHNSQIASYVKKYKAFYRTVAIAHTTLLPFAKESILLAKSFARIGVVTTKTALYSYEILRHFNIHTSFEVLIGREHVLYPKPNAEPLLRAMRDIGVTNSNAWLVGDTNMDILCALNAKCNSYSVTSGYENKESLQNYTSNIVENALEAIQKIKTRYTA